jgi:D-alanyl-D-alanine carboxypeptidase/D-alanyl-D-alanine-endopeptidase (penicillin-binding protein 4)
MKLVVTAAAMSRWGPDYKFGTLFARRGNDIVVIGSGDPGFMDPDLNVKYKRDPTSVFRQWAKILKKAGLSKAGDIIIDDSVFDGKFVHPDWPSKQLNRWYTPPTSGLNLWENGVWIYKHSWDAQKKLKLQVGPTAANGHESNPKLKKGPLAHRRVSVSDGLAVRSGQTGKTMATDPGIFFGSVFRAVLANEGISVSGQVVRQKLTDAQGQLDEQLVLLARNDTKLTGIIRRANTSSRALYAECLFKRLGRIGTQPGNWKTGAAAVKKFLIKKVKVKDFVIADGSGLSVKNRLSPTTLVAVLKYMASRSDARNFRDSLAVWGQSGTLRKRYKKSILAGRVFAKTGYIKGVRSLSGYVRSKRGQWIAFSILMNKVPTDKGLRAKQLQQDICELLVGY